MSNIARMMQRATAGAGGAGLDVDEVFSCFLYEGNNTFGPHTITNGIDLSGEGGLVWLKSRDSASSHGLYDTERGATKYIQSNATSAEATVSLGLTSFNNNGFSVDYSHYADSHASWTWRKAPKFFDVVTYTGNGSSGKTVSHNLGSEVGMLIVKRTDSSDDWRVYHRAMHATPRQKYLGLNSTNEVFDNASIWNDTAPTSTQFTVGNDFSVNQSGGTYVAYLFAHNNNDGEFGPDADQDIIKCGSYTGNGSASGPSINLGFEPQWVIIKKTDNVENWYIYDSMRGVVTGPHDNGLDRKLIANSSSAEGGLNFNDPINFGSTGFNIGTTDNELNNNGSTYIYMAIRRGPLAAPEDATKVFAIDEGDSSGAPEYTSGFPVDMAIKRYSADTDNWRISARLIQGINHFTNTTAADDADAKFKFDYQNGYYNDSQGANNFAWMWKRAPSYFDVVAYKGTGSNRTVSHNLGVAPEMIWVKARDLVEDWNVYHSALGNQAYLKLNTTNQVVTSNTNRWNSTSPTASVFSLGTTDGVNKNSYNYIAYLFATVAGVSKVGSVSHTSGSTTNVDCGFSSGARFVILKASSIASQWMVFDTVRGIVSGVSPFLRLNQTGAEVTSTDIIDPYSTGFAIDPTVSTATYIFYAIA